jgi:hypothetical protein
MLVKNHRLTSARTSPLPMGRGWREAPGEGVRTIDRYYPLTPTLSPWERGQHVVW